ncbi:nucleotidyltransferase family protein [Leptospira wolbachii]|nr:nucleotidyltransferase domain-containing protein [Leptospira wolbachii]
MIQNEIKEKLRQIAKSHEKDGLEIIGYFGSFATNSENNKSDLDVLFRTTKIAADKYPGWKIFNLYEEVRKELEEEFKLKVDLADIDALTEIGKKYIIPSVVYV